MLGLGLVLAEVAMAREAAVMAEVRRVVVGYGVALHHTSPRISETLHGKACADSVYAHSGT